MDPSVEDIVSVLYPSMNCWLIFFLCIDTACVRDGYSDKWHYFDDSKMYLVEESKVVVSQCLGPTTMLVIN